VRVDVAVTLELGRGRSPAARVRVPAGDVPRDAAAGEEPDADGAARPLGGIHSAPDAVEAGTVGLGAGRLDAAAGVVGLAGGVDVAVGRGEGAGETRVVDSAAVAGVKSHGVGRLLVYALYDIDLAVVGPVGAHRPASRECKYCTYFICTEFSWMD